jgi:hypothetical protein
MNSKFIGLFYFRPSFEGEQLEAKGNASGHTKKTINDIIILTRTHQPECGASNDNRHSCRHSI